MRYPAFPIRWSDCFGNGIHHVVAAYEGRFDPRTLCGEQVPREASFSEPVKACSICAAHLHGIVDEISTMLKKLEQSNAKEP